MRSFKKCRATKPTTADERNPKILHVSAFKFPLSNTNAPKIAGMDIKKEYLTVYSLFNPIKSPATKVIPLLEIPGKRAKL